MGWLGATIKDGANRMRVRRTASNYIEPVPVWAVGMYRAQYRDVVCEIREGGQRTVVPRHTQLSERCGESTGVDRGRASAAGDRGWQARFNGIVPVHHLGV